MGKHGYDPKYEKTMPRLYNKLKIIARRTKRSMDLDFKDFLILRGKPCHYCGGTLPELGCGVDRLDNNLPYTIANSVPCCWPCNQLKGKHLTAAELLLLLEFRKNGKISSTS